MRVLGSATPVWIAIVTVWYYSAFVVSACGYQDVSDEVAPQKSPKDLVLAAVIGGEINMTREYVAHLQTKALLLERMIQAEQQRLARRNVQQQPPRTSSSANSSTTSMTNAKRHPRRPSQKQEIFDDWFTPHATWQVPPSLAADSSASSLHIEMLSFKASGNIGGKRNTNPTRIGTINPATPLLQFLMVFNKQNGELSLFHPISHELISQQRLRIPSQVLSVHFHTDRAAHILLVTESGQILLYKIRVFHGRRLVAGDYRRPSGSERLWCAYQVGPSSQGLGTAGSPVSPRESFFNENAGLASTMRTLPPVGMYHHVELEFGFIATPPTKPRIATIVASHQSLFVVAGGDHGQLTFFNGHNGSFISELHTSYGRIVQFQSMASGILAFAVAHRIHFVDVFDRRLLELTCEGSRHQITSMERDSWRHAVLYVGTSDGSGLAFRINRFGWMKRNNGFMPIGADAEGLDDDDMGFPTCALTALLQPRARVFDNPTQSMRHNTTVSVLPGYLLLSSSGGHVVLYDTASSRPGLPAHLAETSLASFGSFSATQKIVAISATRDFLPGAPVALAMVLFEPDSARHRVELFVSRLQSGPAGVEVGWIRAPMMLLCAVGVMFWQQNRFRRPSSSSSMASSLDFDFPSASRCGRKGTGGSDWMKSPGTANHRMRRGI